MQRLRTAAAGRTALSMLLAGVIVLVLVLTGPQPAEAVTVSLTPSAALAGIGANITFDVSVVIDVGERIPIQTVDLRLFSDPECTVELTSPPQGSPRSMSLYQAVPGTGYGYGMLYGNDTGEGQEYYFGYGYGYGGDVTHVYRCYVDTDGWSAGIYYARGDVNCGTHTFQSGISSFRLTSLVAETSIQPYETLNDKFIVIPVTVVRIKDAQTGETVTGITIKRYQARAVYQPAGVNMVNLEPGDPPFDSPVYSIDNVLGITAFGQDTVAGSEPPVTLAVLSPVLVGCAEDSYDLEISFDFLEDIDGELIPHDTPQYLTCQRGDINGDGNITAEDVTVGQQFLDGQLTLNDIWPINMASVHPDQGPGDRCKKNDVQDLEKYLEGKLNCYFE